MEIFILDHIATSGYIRSIMDMRIRFPELLRDSGLTAYQVAVQSKERISLSTAYRLRKAKGGLNTFDADVLDALCDVFGVQPHELLTREPPPKAARRR